MRLLMLGCIACLFAVSGGLLWHASKRTETAPVVLTEGTTIDSANPNDGDTKPEVKNERPRAEQMQIPKAADTVPSALDDYEAIKALLDSAVFKRLDDLNDELKRRGASTSGGRSTRWTIIFKTENGEDYLKQLASFDTKIVMPKPPDWKKNQLFDVLTKPNPGKPLGEQEVPEFYFKDGDAQSAAKVAKTLGLDSKPPYFIAFFPKHVEEKLAELERKFKGLPEKDIFSTTFRVVERDGKYEIKVTEQIPQKKKKD